MSQVHRPCQSHVPLGHHLAWKDDLCAHAQLAMVDARRRPASTIVLALATEVDCDAMALWCSDQLGCSEVEAISRHGLDELRRRKEPPALLVIEPLMAQDALPRAIELLREQRIAHLLILESHPLELHLAAILDEPSTSYFSRAAGSMALAAAMKAILAHGQRVFDPSLAWRICQAPAGFQLIHSEGERSIAARLTPREQEVMQFLAEGVSVRQCATMLGLSAHTVDNHKSRIMKKLGIHKATELTRIALREGLISPQ